jgi:hypothetical protein
VNPLLTPINDSNNSNNSYDPISSEFFIRPSLRLAITGPTPSSLLIDAEIASLAATPIEGYYSPVPFENNPDYTRQTAKLKGKDIEKGATWY